MEEKFRKELGLLDDISLTVPGDHPAITDDRQLQTFRGKLRPHLDLLLQAFTSAPLAGDWWKKRDSEIFASLRMPPVREIDHTNSCRVIANLAAAHHAAPIHDYLDLGCGSCCLARAIGDRLGVRASGSDVATEFESGWGARPSEVDFATVTDDAPLGHVGKQWDLITAIQVLHHIPDIEKTLDAIADSLRVGGLLILKEHDTWTPWERVLVDLEHSLYLVQKNDNWRERVHAQYIRCRTWIEWTWLLWRRGLRLVYMAPYGNGRLSYGVTRKVLMAFTKSPPPLAAAEGAPRSAS